MKTVLDPGARPITRWLGWSVGSLPKWLRSAARKSVREKGVTALPLCRWCPFGVTRIVTALSPRSSAAFSAMDSGSQQRAITDISTALLPMISDDRRFQFRKGDSRRFPAHPHAGSIASKPVTKIRTGPRVVVDGHVYEFPSDAAISAAAVARDAMADPFKPPDRRARNACRIGKHHGRQALSPQIEKPPDNTLFHSPRRPTRPRGRARRLLRITAGMIRAGVTRSSRRRVVPI